MNRIAWPLALVLVASVMAVGAPTATSAATPFTDIADSKFRSDIEWAYDTGITVGCSDTTFCPKGLVTREQMATFLSRMFKLPATSTDYFTDDNTSRHQPAINKVAAAGITVGCDTNKFCPGGLVSRDQMASFISRAAKLSAGAGNNYFWDDNGNRHEPSIDRVAAAGITTGCASYQYCPKGSVTREQMTAFLRRVLSPRSAPPYPAPSPWAAAPAPASPSGSTPTAAGALYVSPSGSDSNAGSANAPLRTVAKGLASVRAGQTLYLRGGTYVEDIALRMPAGTAAAPIVVSAYPGERPVIKGLVALTDPTHVTFDGFNVTWNTGGYDEHMFKITGGSHWTLQNSEIWGARSFANVLISGNPQQWTLRGNIIHDTYGGEADVNRSHNIYANTGLGAGGGLIERNLIFNAPHGTNLKLAGSGGSDGGAANVTVRYNTLYSATQPLLIGDGSHNITVTRNIIGASARGNLVRLYELVGANVSVRDNLGFAGDAFCDDYNSPTPCSSVVSTSRFPHDPRFTATDVGGFRPQDSTAATYGRYAP